MKKKNKTTYNYNLKNGRRVVYKGTTNNPERRLDEHVEEGKKFTHMQVVGRAKTPNGANKEEARQLATYRRNNGGKNPKYNKTKKG